jgi:hypothetical protein
MDAELHPALRDYLRSLGELSASYEPSLFWQRELRELADAAGVGEVGRITSVDVGRVVAASEYALEPLPPDAEAPARDKRYRHTLKAVRRAHDADRENTPEAHALDREEWWHGRALLLLAGRDLLDGYLTFLAGLGVRSSYRAAWNYWYLLELEHVLAEHGPGRPLDVVEIGPGSGMLGCFLHRRGLTRRYTMIDLPEMLVVSGYTVARHCPDATLTFNQPPSGEPAFALLAPQHAADVPDECADLVLNVSSFMEMDRSVRDDYIALLYRVARPGALFYNVNRRQRALPQPGGGTFDNNPLLYPYRPDDRVLLWEEDEFQQAVRARFNEVPSLAIKRAAIVKPR